MIDIVYQVSGVNIGTISLPIEKFNFFLDNYLSVPELERSLIFSKLH